VGRRTGFDNRGSHNNTLFRQMNIRRFLARATALAGLATCAVIAQADPIATAWTDWKKDAATTMSGTLMLASGAVKVKFSAPTIYFDQIGEEFDRDYWTYGDAAYAATGRPAGKDLIGFIGGTGDAQYRITFSRPVTDPVFAILSLGRAGQPARYVFKQTPVVLSSGAGYYGGCADCLSVSRKTLSGTEGHGIVQFIGTYKSITWTEPDAENWHGIQVGAPVDQ
jgi:hypothetical protein